MALSAQSALQTPALPPGSRSRCAATRYTTTGRNSIPGSSRERRAKAVLQRDRFGATAVAIEWLQEAMAWYERAEAIRPVQNDDSLLRWNACARLLMELPAPTPDANEPEPLGLGMNRIPASFARVIWDAGNLAKTRSMEIRRRLPRGCGRDTARGRPHRGACRPSRRRRIGARGDHRSPARRRASSGGRQRATRLRAWRRRFSSATGRR